MSEKAYILYMEDNEATARLLQKRLSRSGYAIDIASNGEAGLELCAARPYDAIIVDYNMPGLNGMQVMQRLVAQGVMPPTIMLTGTGNERVAVEALKLGAFDYVIKDIDGVYLDLLPTVIEQALRNQQLLEDKHRAEEALRESEKRFRSVIEQSLDGIALIDQDGKIVEWNRAEEVITNVRREEALGQYIWDMSYRMMPPESRERIPYQALRAMFDELLGNRRSPWLDQIAEYEIVRPDEERRTIQAARYIIDLDDHFLVSEISRDISERKRMENALRESEERFRMLFEEAPDPYFVNDLAGNLIDCNRAVEPLLGLSINDLIGKNFVEMGLVASNQLEEVAETLTKILQGGVTRPPELTITRPDGREVAVDLHMLPIQTKGQTQILGIGHDITWRKQAEAQMKVHVERSETLSRIDDELTRRLDIQYVQMMALENMMRVSGANAGSIALIREAMILSIHSVGYPGGVDHYYSLDGCSIAARAARRQKAEWVQDVAADPDYCAVLADTRSQIALPLMSQNQLMGVVSLETNRLEHFNAEMFEFLKLIAARIAVAIDNAQLYNTSQKQLVELQSLYERISRLEQLKTDMIRMASHDLRNPLAVVSTCIYVLRKTLGDQLSEKQQAQINTIGRAVKQMEAITTDFLSLERIEENTQGEFSGQDFNLRDLVQSVFESFQLQTEEKTQVYRFFSPEMSLPVRGGKAELQQVIANIIGNAVKYTPDGGTIDVNLRQQNALARLEVIDTGYGIPPEQHEKLFQPFFRAQTEETASIEGTGLGLYLVKKIVERNSGQLIFHSEYGKGSTFGFELPLSAE